MDEIGVKGFRPQNKKRANNQWRLPPKGLFCKTLCPKEVRWIRTHISREWKRTHKRAHGGRGIISVRSAEYEWNVTQADKKKDHERNVAQSKLNGANWFWK